MGGLTFLVVVTLPLVLVRDERSQPRISSSSLLAPAVFHFLALLSVNSTPFVHTDRHHPYGLTPRHASSEETAG